MFCRYGRIYHCSSKYQLNDAEIMAEKLRSAENAHLMGKTTATIGLGISHI